MLLRERRLKPSVSAAQRPISSSLTFDGRLRLWIEDVLCLMQVSRLPDVMSETKMTRYVAYNNTAWRGRHATRLGYQCPGLGNGGLKGAEQETNSV